MIPANTCIFVVLICSPIFHLCVAPRIFCSLLLCELLVVCLPKVKEMLLSHVNDLVEVNPTQYIVPGL